MQEIADRLKASATGVSGGLLAGQMLFAVAFVSACEVPNFMSGQPQKNACLERWTVAGALFIPSGLSKSSLPLPAPAPAKTEPRRTTRRTTKTTTAKKA